MGKKIKLLYSSERNQAPQKHKPQQKASWDEILWSSSSVVGTSTGKIEVHGGDSAGSRLQQEPDFQCLEEECLRICEKLQRNGNCVK